MKSKDFFAMGTGIVVTLGLIIGSVYGLIWYRNQQSEILATASAQIQTERAEMEAAIAQAIRNREQVQLEKISPLEPRRLIERLRNLPPEAKKGSREAFFCFEGLLQGGTNSLPAIREYFLNGDNASLKGSYIHLYPKKLYAGVFSTGTPYTTRFGLLGVLGDMDNLEAIGFLSQLLPTIQNPSELMILSKLLLEVDPSLYTNPILAQVEQLLNGFEEGIITERDLYTLINLLTWVDPDSAFPVMIHTYHLTKDLSLMVTVSNLLIGEYPAKAKEIVEARARELLTQKDWGANPYKMGGLFLDLLKLANLDNKELAAIVTPDFLSSGGKLDDQMLMYLSDKLGKDILPVLYATFQESWVTPREKTILLFNCTDSLGRDSQANEMFNSIIHSSDYPTEEKAQIPMTLFPLSADDPNIQSVAKSRLELLSAAETQCQGTAVAELMYPFIHKVLEEAATTGKVQTMEKLAPELIKIQLELQKRGVSFN